MNKSTTNIKLRIWQLCGRVILILVKLLYAISEHSSYSNTFMRIEIDICKNTT